jgi:hypothetical protein
MTARLAGCGGMKSGVLPRAGTTFSSVATARLVRTLLALLAQKKVLEGWYNFFLGGNGPPGTHFTCFTSTKKKSKY